MSPYYQPPRDEEWDKEIAQPAPIERTRPARHGWYFYVGGFFLLLAGACLVLSNSLGWHPSPNPPPTLPSATSVAR